MLVIIWLTLLLLACATLHQTLTRRLPAVLGALSGLILFIVVALGALELTVVSGGSVALTESSEPLAFVGLAGIVINVVYLLAAFTNSLPTGSPADRSDMS